MKLEWRKELFHQKPSQSGANPLVLPMSKAKATKILGICPRTLKRWMDVAGAIPEYRLILVQMKTLADKKKLRAPPITAYQVWVIGKIGELFTDIAQGIDKKALVETIVEANKGEYTRSLFEQEQLNFTSQQEASQPRGTEEKDIVNSDAPNSSALFSSFTSLPQTLGETNHVG